ncbi:MAG: hypothetical protein VX583_06110 [Bdellovibrionota bacterium]
MKHFKKNLIFLLLIAFPLKAFSNSFQCPKSAGNNKSLAKSEIREHTKLEAHSSELNKLVRNYSAIYSEKKDNSKILKQELAKAMLVYYEKHRNSFESYAHFARHIRYLAGERESSQESRSNLPGSQTWAGTEFTFLERDQILWESKDKSWSILISGLLVNKQKLTKETIILSVIENDSNLLFRLPYDVDLESIKEWNSGLLIKTHTGKNIFLYKNSLFIKIQEMDRIFHIDKDKIYFAEKVTTPEPGFSFQTLTVTINETKITENRDQIPYLIDEIAELRPNHFIVKNNSTGNPYELIFKENETPVIRETKIRNTEGTSENMHINFFQQSLLRQYFEVTHLIDGKKITEKVALPLSKNIKGDFGEGSKRYYSIDPNNFIISIKNSSKENSESLWFQRNSNGVFKLKESLNYMEIIKHNSSHNLIVKDLEANWFRVDLANPNDKLALEFTGNLQLHDSLLIKLEHDIYEIYKFADDLQVEKLLSWNLALPESNSQLSFKASTIANEHLFLQTNDGQVIYTNLKKPQELRKLITQLSSFHVVESDSLNLVLALDQNKENLYLVELNENQFPIISNKINIKDTFHHSFLDTLPIRYKGNRIYIGNTLYLEIAKISNFWEN